MAEGVSVRTRLAAGMLMSLFRERLLAKLVEAHAISPELVKKSDHIPDPGQHRTLFYGEYSNRVRGSGHPDDGEATRSTRSSALLDHLGLGSPETAKPPPPARSSGVRDVDPSVPTY